MWSTLAAEAGADPSGSLIIAVFVFLGVVVTALGTVVVAFINSRAASRTAPSPPPPAGPGSVDARLTERIAVLEHRADDGDERNEVQDRRLDQIEDVLDVDNPRWAHLRDRRAQP